MRKSIRTRSRTVGNADGRAFDGASAIAIEGPNTFNGKRAVIRGRGRVARIGEVVRLQVGIEARIGQRHSRSWIRRRRRNGLIPDMSRRDQTRGGAGEPILAFEVW